MPEMTYDRSPNHETSLQRVHTRLRIELMGRSHGSVEELRARAERCTDANRLAADVVESNDRQVHLVVGPTDRSGFHIYAERTYPWHPFYVRAVERSET